MLSKTTSGLQMQLSKKMIVLYMVIMFTLLAMSLVVDILLVQLLQFMEAALYQQQVVLHNSNLNEKLVIHIHLLPLKLLQVT